ncbi:hypothetical protein T265_14942, partial [Opisthorchis viverrini]
MSCGCETTSLRSEDIGRIDHRCLRTDQCATQDITHLGSCISSDCSVTDEVNARICKARAAFANLRHLWRQNGLSLNLKGRVYQATVRAVLLYGCETWPIRTADLRRLQVFDNRCLKTIAR